MPTVQASALRDAAQGLSRQLVAWRRHLHEHPEVSFQEHETAAYVARCLAEMPGLEVERPTETSVVARLRGRAGGRVIALRADLDALPIHEHLGAAVRSRVDGVMHACGHDGHTAMLLGVARLLTAAAATFDGELRLLFQHAEEQPPGGARDLVRAGVLDGVDAIVGCHLWTALPTGSVAIAPGSLMAGSDDFTITVAGRGGHASEPHRTIDPIAIGADVVTAISQLVARQVDALAPLVVSVTRFSAGTTTNVVPDSAELAGTIRWFDAEARDDVVQKLERLVAGVAAARGATHRLEIRPGYAPVVNDPDVTARVEAVLRDLAGDAAVTRMKPVMGSEDFGAYLESTPGTFFFLGTRNEALGAHHPHHHPSFAIDEASLAHGVELMAGAALGLLADGG